MVSQAEVAHVARDLVGTEYLHQGRRVETGVDCIGLFIVISQVVGKPLADCRTYSWEPETHILVGELTDQMDQVPVGKEAHLVIAWLRRPGEPQHVLVPTPEGGYIHAPRGSSVRNVPPGTKECEFWDERLDSGWRLR